MSTTNETILDLVDEYNGYKIYKKRGLEPASGEQTKIFFRAHKGENIHRFFVILPNFYDNWLDDSLESNLGDVGIKAIKLQLKRNDFNKDIYIKPEDTESCKLITPREYIELLDAELSS
jgi:hypothetical protein